MPPQWTLVTDDTAPDEQVRIFRAAGVDVVVVQTLEEQTGA